MHFSQWFIVLPCRDRNWSIYSEEGCVKLRKKDPFEKIFLQ